MVARGENVDKYTEQVREMAALAKAASLNIDYFPTNFVVRDGILWYIDYECNEYMDEWSFENWGIKYWPRTAMTGTWASALPGTARNSGRIIWPPKGNMVVFAWSTLRRAL